MPPPPPPQQQPPHSPSPLPTPRALLTNLLHTFSTFTTNPSTPLTTPAKPLLLTLHALFPTTLLPALDLLDRHLITKLIYNPNYNPNAKASPAAREIIPNKETRKAAVEGKRVVYYVKSAARQRARYAGGGAMCYEVRTRGWSCSCAAFAFAAAGGGGEGWGYEGAGGGGGIEGLDGGEEMLFDREEGGKGVEELGEGAGRVWGGLMAGEDVPLCKHLFACVIAENWDVAGEMVEERVVGREEMAGWAAGWGG